MSENWERWSRLTGALAVPFWVAAVILISSAVKGSKGPRILASYHSHSNSVLLAGFLWSIGVLLFIWFLGCLRSDYLAAEGGSGRLSMLAYGGGLAAAAIAMLIPAADTVGALNKTTSTPLAPPSCITSRTASSSPPSTFCRFSFSPVQSWRCAIALCRSGLAGQAF